MDISSLIYLRCEKKSPKKSERGKCPKIDEIQDGRQPNNQNMIIVIIIVLIMTNSSVIYLIILAFLLMVDAVSKLLDQEETKRQPKKSTEFRHGCTLHNLTGE